MLLLSLLIAAAGPSSIDWNPAPEALTQACTSAVERYRGAVASLAAAAGPATFASVVLPLEQAQADLDDAAAPARVLEADALDADLRDAARDCRESVETASESAQADPRLYARLARVFHGVWAHTPADRALGLRWLALLRDGGATLAPEPRRELLLRRAELDAIGAAYDAHPDASLFARAVATRDRLAHLLGYESWSAYALARTSLRSPMAAEKLVDTALARTRDVPAAAADDASDARAFAEHFPLDGALAAIFGAYGDLFGVAIAPANDTAWAPEVRAYDVTDPVTGSLLGEVLLDLAARDPRGPQLLVPARADGTAVHGALALVREDVPPAPRRDVRRLDHAQLARLLGDTGGAIAMLFARSPYERLNRFAPDLARVPSAMFERLAWEPSVLARLCVNGSLPDATLARVTSSRAAADERRLAADASFASVDLALADTGSAADTQAAWRSLSVAQRAAIVRDGGFVTVRYPLAQLYAADLFTAFEGSPLDPALGLRYRQTVLDPAGESLAARAARFLGRPLDLERIFAEASP